MWCRFYRGWYLLNEVLLVWISSPSNEYTWFTTARPVCWSSTCVSVCHTRSTSVSTAECPNNSGTHSGRCSHVEPALEEGCGSTPRNTPRWDKQNIFCFLLYILSHLSSKRASYPSCPNEIVHNFWLHFLASSVLMPFYVHRIIHMTHSDSPWMDYVTCQHFSPIHQKLIYLY